MIGRLVLAAAAVAAAGPVTALPLDRLAGIVGDRIAGEPVDCIEAAEIDGVHLVPGGFAYVMRSPATVFVNLPETGGGFIHNGVTPAVDRTGALLCRNQPVALLGENSLAPVATIRLGPFVPYRRPSPRDDPPRLRGGGA